MQVLRQACEKRKHMPLPALGMLTAEIEAANRRSVAETANFGKVYGGI